MQYTTEIYSRVFENTASKQAYLSCRKWLAKNVYGSQSYSERIAVKVVKLENRIENVKKGKKENRNHFLSFSNNFILYDTVGRIKRAFLQ